MGLMAIIRCDIPIGETSGGQRDRCLAGIYTAIRISPDAVELDFRGKKLDDFSLLHFVEKKLIFRY